MVKLAMIGAGGYAFNLIKWMWGIPDKIEVVAVTSRPKKEKSTGVLECEKRGIPVYDDIDQLMANVKDKVDVIYVPTPIQTHFAYAKKCINAGYDIFLEKPPVSTIQDMDALMQFVADKGLAQRVPIGFQSLYSRLVQELKKRMVEGTHGKVKRIKAMAGWPRLDTYYNRSSWSGKIKMDDGWVLDGTINNPLAHAVANQLYFASSEPGKMASLVSIEAELYHGHDIESEDTSSVRAITDTGVEILFNASLCSDERMDPLITLECEKATIDYYNYKQVTVKSLDGKVEEEMADDTEPRANMLKSMAESYTNNTPYIVPLEMCRPFIEFVNGAFESGDGISAIDKQYVKRVEQEDGDVKTIIDDIDNVLKTSHAEGKLFSEVGAKWAKKSKVYELAGYKKFPSDVSF
ncbi:MAG: Gfo/Idh/MocA family oxidoreductase [Sedimentisphaerales bacterium]|nr:Gfo/Idh/MocA family oxidoreductase [Sedimentisphaerales bacterium]